VTQTATLANYSDADTVSVWAEEAVRWANATGLLNGRSATELDFREKIFLRPLKTEDSFRISNY
jgi:hypothetical protein